MILLCPRCSQPIATTKDHRIASLEPLTIEKPLACVYSRGARKDAMPTVIFNMKDGNGLLSVLAHAARLTARLA